jgi:UDP-N-acetylglucosamine 4-epimerase
METIGLRYFNVFGRKQDPDGPYAAVIPKFVKLLIKGQSPVINGDGSFSRDFTYVDNVIQANELAATINNPDALNTVYNVAFGQQTTLNELVDTLVKELSQFNSNISSIKATHAPNRQGDIPHSLASIEKAKSLLGYYPEYDFKSGIKNAVKWYWENLQ